MNSSPELTEPEAASLPTIVDIRRAAERLRGEAVRTPLLEAPLLNERVGGRILLKAECLQRTGSFKFRGAYNRIAQIPEDDRKNGVVGYSSGNHAQGVACAAQMLGIPATIVMPSDAPRMKIENTRTYGADVVLYERFSEDRDAISKRIAAEKGATIIRPFDDPGIISGQGTIGLELAEQLAEAGAAPDAVTVCCGGGGLISGTALALEDTLPGVPVYAVEPSDFDDTVRSLEAGQRLGNPPEARSICDALLSPMPGALTFAINRRLLAGGVGVTDDEALEAMAIAFRYLKIVLEPGGAVSLAAVLTGKVPVSGRTVAVVASGGNCDPDMFASALERFPD